MISILPKRRLTIVWTITKVLGASDATLWIRWPYVLFGDEMTHYRLTIHTEAVPYHMGVLQL